MRVYRAITGLADDGQMPVLAPQVMAVGLHLAVLGDRRFPFRALGLVHAENAVTVVRAVPETTTLSLTASVAHARPAPRGTLFDLVAVTEAATARSAPGPPPSSPEALHTDLPPSERPRPRPLGGWSRAWRPAPRRTWPTLCRRRRRPEPDSPAGVARAGVRVSAGDRARDVDAGAHAGGGGRARAAGRSLHARFRKPLLLPSDFVIEARVRDDGGATLTAAPADSATARPAWWTCPRDLNPRGAAVGLCRRPSQGDTLGSCTSH